MDITYHVLKKLSRAKEKYILMDGLGYRTYMRKIRSEAAGVKPGSIRIWYNKFVGNDRYNDNSKDFIFKQRIHSILSQFLPNDFLFNLFHSSKRDSYWRDMI